MAAFSPQRQRIYVFGSNLAGIHGAGSALVAVRKHGAILKQGRGLQGNSYGIPTKNQYIRTRPLVDIAPEVASFVEFAKAHPEMDFEIQDIGCLNAGYTPGQIAPMFKDAPGNCFFSDNFASALQGMGHACKTWAQLPEVMPEPAPQASLF